MDRFPCPHTGDICQRGDCPTTACVYDLDEALEPEHRVDCTGYLTEPERWHLFGEA